MLINYSPLNSIYLNSLVHVLPLLIVHAQAFGVTTSIFFLNNEKYINYAGPS